MLRFLITALFLTVAYAHAERAPASFGTAEGPLQVRNLAPVTLLYGLPRMYGAQVLEGGTQVSLNFEAVNNFQSDDVGGTFVFFDGETYVSNLHIRGSVTREFEWGLEIPWIVHAPGSLDGVVDEFHELFGLPDGERSLASRGRLDYYVGSGGQVYADFDASRRTVGDISAWAGWQWFDDHRGMFAMRTQLKLPTGKVGDLSGSEGTDLAVWGEYQYAFPWYRRGLRLSLGGGMAYLGEGELIPHAQRHWVHFGHLGLQFALTPRTVLIGQLDAHSQVLDTGNPLIADGGVLGTLGARIGLVDQSWLDLAIIEDLANESASDVVFQIRLGIDF